MKKINILGIGETGRQYKRLFSEYSNYNYLLADIAARQTKKSLRLPVLETFQEYDKYAYNVPFSNLKGKLWCIVPGGARETGCILRVLEQLKECQINILYLLPNLEGCGEEQKINHQICFGVLQEYARSGVFETMYLRSELETERMVPELSIGNYHEDLNRQTVYLTHTLNTLKNTKPLFEFSGGWNSISRIGTYGIVSDRGEEQYLHNLQNISEKHFYFCFPRKNLLTTKNSREILEQVRENVKLKQTDGVRTGWSIFGSENEEETVFVEARSGRIQK